MGDFGDKFRKAREKRELSLDDVSNVTKINARMLRAIEEEHFEDLPGGVFNKGFIRAYAKHLGLDAEEAVSDYLASLRQAQIVANEMWEPKVAGTTHAGSNGGTPPAPAIKKPVSKPPISKPIASKPPVPVPVEELPDLHLPRAEDVRSSRKEFLKRGSGDVPWKIVAAGALVLALAVFLWIRHSSRTPAAGATGNPVSPAPAAQPVATPASQNISRPASTPPPSSPLTTNTASTVSTSTASTPQPEVQPPEKSAPAKSSTPPSPVPETENSSDVTVKNFAKVTPKPAEKPAPGLSLVIRANENSWISIFADGELVTQETLIAPAHTSVRASREISVRVGNAAGVSFVWNGKEIPAQGTESEVKNFVFDSSGLRDSSAAGVP